MNMSHNLTHAKLKRPVQMDMNKCKVNASVLWDSSNIKIHALNALLTQNQIIIKIPVFAQEILKAMILTPILALQDAQEMKYFIMEDASVMGLLYQEECVDNALKDQSLNPTATHAHAGMDLHSILQIIDVTLDVETLKFGETVIANVLMDILNITIYVELAQKVQNLRLMEKNVIASGKM